MSTTTLPTKNTLPELKGQFIPGPHGISLYVEDYGDPHAKTKILLVHGVLQSSLCYRRQVEALAGQGYYVVALDLPWHGFSVSAPKELVPTAEIFGDSLAAVCAHFGLLLEGSLILLGWSFGGIVVRNFLLQHHPHNISGLVYVAALHDFESFTVTCMRDYPQVGELFQGLVTSNSPMSDRLAWFQTFVNRLWYRSPRLEEYYEVLGYNFRSFAGCAHVMEALALGSQAPGDLPQALENLGCPILMMQGQNDQLLPADYTRQFAQTLPSDQVQLLDFPACGHSPFLEYPDAFNAALFDFLAGPVRRFVIESA